MTKTRMAKEYCDDCGSEMQPIPDAEKKVKAPDGFKVVAVVKCHKCSIARAVFEELK